jgi:hypothetical protein
MEHGRRVVDRLGDYTICLPTSTGLRGWSSMHGRARRLLCMGVLGGFGTLWIAKPSLTQKRSPGRERESPRCSANPKVDPLHLWVPSDLACGP